ncbi:MAG: hypothetical protein WC856_02280 [Methylococcaceae bacterium]|jgi:hypothetical protein
MDTRNCLNCESFRTTPEHDHCNCNNSMIGIPTHCKHYEQESTTEQETLTDLCSDNCGINLSDNDWGHQWEL